MTISDAEFNRIVTFVKRHYGVNLTEKRTLIVGRLENFLVRNGYNSYSEYIDKVERDVTGEECKQLINILTTNHTYFMRESVHFEFLKNVVLPKLKLAEADTKDIRIWCAAASSGEEAYTIEMILRDFFMFDPGWDTSLLATDISTRVLEMAIKGRYLKEQTDVLPNSWVKRYFTSVDSETYEVKDELKRQVVFRPFNLMNPIPFRKKFHAVFLRNVMIYFDEKTKYDLVRRIYDYMEPGGYLFIGTTESLNREYTKFRYVSTSIYQKLY